MKEEFQKVVDLLSSGLADGTGKKVQIRVYRKNFLHAKCYIFGTDEENAVGIIGSSNFTKQGLFGNLKLNQFEDNNATVNFLRKNPNQHPSHRSWFEDLWSVSDDWTRTFREEVLYLALEIAITRGAMRGLGGRFRPRRAHSADPKDPVEH